ncbi:MAG: hypothetical protein ABIA04_05665 [Pseudomonadota bacterium]
MEIKKIGKIQIWIGCIILLITIISSVIIVRNVYFDTLTESVAGMTSVWGDVASRQINGTSIGVEGHVISFIVTEATIFKMTLSVFVTCALILVVLSIILITQGLANLNRK